MKGSLINFANEKEKNQGKSLSIFGELYFGSKKWQSVISTEGLVPEYHSTQQEQASS